MVYHPEAMALFTKRPAVDENPHATIQECLRKRDYKGALGAFEALLKKPGPGNSQLRMRYADTLVLAARKADAVREYSKVAEELAETGFLVRAVAIYKKVVKLDPSQGDAVAKLARLDAERSQHSASAAASAAASAQSMSASISTSSSSDELGDFEEDSGGGMEFDIGAGMGLGGGASPAGPGPQAARAAATPVRRPDASLDDLDVSPDELGDALDAAELEPASGVAAAAPDLSLGADLAPDPGLLAPDPTLEPDSALLAPDDLEPPAPEPRPLPSFSPPTPAPPPAPASAGLGFDFGFGGPTPATATAKSEAPAPSGLSFDFGGGDAPQPGPVASGADLSFSLGGDAPATAPPSTVASGADLSFSLGGGDAASEPGVGDAVSEDLLGLLGDDIDTMLDDILSDVGSDEAGVAPALPPASTNIGLFAHLTIDEFVDVLKILNRTTVKKGDAIVREGDAGESMFIITTGKVAATIERDGESVTVATLGDGNFFGEMSVLSGEPRTATVTALENTELLVLERDQLLDLLSSHPEVEAKLMLAQAERADHTAALKAGVEPSPLG